MVTKPPSKGTNERSSRRDQIILAALDVIRDRGVDGLTHRAVAEQAGVSVGLTTYYFSSLEDILEGAFDLAMQRDMEALSAWVKGLESGADLAAELTDMVLKQVERNADSVYVNFVLVLASMHRPNLQVKAHAWANWLTELMNRHLSEQAASAVATVYDGTLLRLAMTKDFTRQDEVQSAFKRACGDEHRWLRQRRDAVCG